MQELFSEGFDEIIDAEDYAEFNKRYANKGIEVLLKGLGKFYEYLDRYLSESNYRKQAGLVIKDSVNKNLLTSLGNITYKKIVYVDRDNKTRYLLDEYVGIKSNERMMPDKK